MARGEFAVADAAIRTGVARAEEAFGPRFRGGCRGWLGESKQHAVAPFQRRLDGIGEAGADSRGDGETVNDEFDGVIAFADELDWLRHIHDLTVNACANETFAFDAGE